MVLFIGPPGCGKGTQALLFEQNHGFDVLSFGEFLRALSKLDNELGIKIKNILELGDVVSPEIIFDNIDISLFKKKIILDGFPRSLEQAFFFDSFSKTNGLKIKCIIEFKIEIPVLIERIKGRKICDSCLKTFLTSTCNCGSKNFSTRLDDNLAVFENRLLNYRNNQKLLFKFYKSQGNYFTIDARGSIEMVYNRIKKVIKTCCNF